jgi:hypothetical protein
MATDDINNVYAGQQLLDEILRNHPASLTREPGFHLGGNCRHIGAPGQCGTHLGHDLTHVLWARRASGDNGDLDGGLYLRGVGLFGEVTEQYGQLKFFAVGEILSATRFKLGNGVATLLGKFLNDCGNLRIVKRNAFVDLALLHGSKQHSQRRQAVSVASPHRRLHVFSDSLFEAHRDFRSQ